MRRRKQSLTHKRLTQVLSYDRSTGLFRWRVKNARTEVGQIAGCDSDRGYVKIKIDQVQYYGHQLAWFYVHKKWPNKNLDHRDTSKGNNRLRNIRRASVSQNGANRGKQKNNTSGHKGVFLDRKYNRWYAAIVKDRKMKNLGYADTREKAAAIYARAAKLRFGEFART